MDIQVGMVGNSGYMCLNPADRTKPEAEIWWSQAKVFETIGGDVSLWSKTTHSQLDMLTLKYL